MAVYYPWGNVGPGGDIEVDGSGSVTITPGPIPGTFTQLWATIPTSAAAQTTFQVQGRKTVPKTLWNARVTWLKTNDDALLVQTNAKNQVPSTILYPTTPKQYPTPPVNKWAWRAATRWNASGAAVTLKNEGLWNGTNVYEDADGQDTT
jgi:hypothetical protein